MRNNIRFVSSDSASKVRTEFSSRRNLLFVIATIVVLLTVQISGSSEWFSIVTAIAVSSVAAMALTVLIGWAGQPSLLAGASLLIGGVCASAIPAKTPGSLLIALLVSVVAGGLIGGIAALPSRRLVGTYLLLSTMALQFVVSDAVNYVQSKTDRTAGYSLGHPNLFFVSIGTQASWLWATGIGVLLVFEYFLHLKQTRVGRSLAIIRDNAGAAAVAGVNVRKHLTWIFIVTSAVMSMAGALDGYYTQSVTYEGFGILVSISFFVMVVLGGPGSLIGAVLGCAFVVGMPQVLPLFSNAASQSTVLPYIEQLLYGLIGMVVLIGRFGTVPILKHVSALVSSKSRVTSSGPGPSAPKYSSDNLEDSSVNGVNLPSVSLGGGSNLVSGESQPNVMPILNSGSSNWLCLENIHVSYKGSVYAVRGVNLELAQGSAVAIVGPNGAGKTSLLLAAAGFPVGADGRVSTGRVLYKFDGKEQVVNGMTPEERVRLGIAFVPAEDKVFNELTVDEHLRLSMSRRATAKEIDLLKEEFFTVFSDVKPLLSRRAGLLSGGQRQQLALMCALMKRPKILIVDELSLGLSPMAIEKVVEILLQVKSRRTTGLLLAEQNVSVAFSISDSIAVMAGGELKSAGEPSADFEESVRLQFVGSNPQDQP